ncbi:DUF3329 domain-containing protein [Gammaproteobacteria bacterium]
MSEDYIRRVNIKWPPMTWSQRLLFGLAIALLLVLGLLLGMVLIGVGAIAVILLSLRFWWLRRKLRRSGKVADGFIEAEYQVVDEHQGICHRPESD